MSRTVLDRLLRPFSRVYPGEGLVATLFLLCVSLILTSYYVLKTAREGLILARGSFGLRGDELKTYASGAMALLLLGVIPAYGALAARVRRIRLINVSYVIVLVCLVGFFVLGEAGVPIGLPFFIWLGLVNVFVIAQFWSYANDLYTEEQGKRLFAIIAIGGSVGAIVGPQLARLADTFSLLLIAAALLIGCVALFNLIERVHHRVAPDDPIAATPITGEGGFALVLRDRYLLLIAGLLFAANLVNTTGEYILSNVVSNHAAALFPDGAGTSHAAITAARREMIKAFYGDFFFWVNLAGLVIQAFVVSRVIQRLGVRRALFVLPVIAFCAYGAIGAIGGIAIVRVAKIAENSTDYSLQNTVRQMLFLPTSRAAKYKAKAAIDTFFVRAGDMLAAIVVGFGIHQLGFSGRQLAFVNLGVTGVWFAIAAGIARRHLALTGDGVALDEPRPSAPLPAGAPA